MGKIIITAVAVASLAVPAVASAATQNSNASPTGATHGAFADVNGNFGSLGADGGASDHGTITGRTSGATGNNNSTAGHVA